MHKQSLEMTGLTKRIVSGREEPRGAEGRWCLRRHFPHVFRVKCVKLGSIPDGQTHPQSEFRITMNSDRRIQSPEVANQLRPADGFAVGDESHISGQPTQTRPPARSKRMRGSWNCRDCCSDITTCLYPHAEIMPGPM